MVAWWVPCWSWVHQQTWICIGEGMITGSQLAGSANTVKLTASRSI